MVLGNNLKPFSFLCFILHFMAGVVWLFKTFFLVSWFNWMTKRYTNLKWRQQQYNVLLFPTKIIDVKSCCSTVAGKKLKNGFGNYKLLDARILMRGGPLKRSISPLNLTGASGLPSLWAAASFPFQSANLCLHPVHIYPQKTTRVTTDASAYLFACKD